MKAPVTIAWVAAVWRYPVKSMQGERLAEAAVSPAGLDGDRRWAVVTGDGKALSAKTVPELLLASAAVDGDGVVVTLPTGATVSSADSGADEALSDWLGRRVRLEQAGADDLCQYDVHVDATDLESPTVTATGPRGSYRDSNHPLHVLTTASLRAAAARHPGGDWDARRFRPNVLVDTDGEGYVEDEWVGGRVTVGAVALSVTKPTVRCTIPTRPQPGLRLDVGITRSLARHHGLTLGAYAAVLQGGSLAEGAEVTLG